MTSHMIPAEAVEAGWEQARADADGYPYPEREDIRRILEAAAPHMLIHVHHHDIENHARSYNEGYETCMAQDLAADPTIAQDWLDEKLAEAWDAAAAWVAEGHPLAPGAIQSANPYRPNL